MSMNTSNLTSRSVPQPGQRLRRLPAKQAIGRKRPIDFPTHPLIGFKELPTLLKFSREITQNLTLDRVLQSVLEKSFALLKADAGVLHLLSNKGNSLRIGKRQNVSQAFSQALRHKEGIADCAFQGKKAIVVSNIGKDPHFFWKATGKKEGFTSAICVPLPEGETPIGTLTLLSRKGRYFARKEAFLLSSLADHAAVAVANARYCNKIEKQLREVSRLRKTEKRVKDFLENIVDRSVDPILVTDLHGRITFVSKGAVEIFGCPQNELLGKPISDLYLRGRSEAGKIMKLLFQKERLRNYETELLNNEKKIVSVILSASLVRDAQGNPVGTLGVSKDVTEYKRLLNHITQTEKSYQKLFEALNDAIFFLNGEGFFTTFNRMFLKMTGYTEKEIRGFHFSRLIHPEDLPGDAEGPPKSDARRICAGALHFPGGQ